MPQEIPVRLVCFDLGRVFVRICDDWRHACRVAGIAIPAMEIDAARLEMLHDLSVKIDIGEISFDRFAGQAGPLMGLTPEEVRRASDGYLLGAYAGIAPLLDTLHGAGLMTACLSNTNANHWRLMSDATHPSHVHLDKLTHRFASHLVGHRKPGAKIYEHVERATGLRGEEIIFFDDVAENVIAAAKRNWRAHQIDPAPDDPMSQIRAALGRHGIRT